MRPARQLGMLLASVAFGCAPTHASPDAPVGAVDATADASNDSGSDTSTDVGRDAPAYLDAGAPPPFMLGLSNISRSVEALVDRTGTRWVRQVIGWDTLEPTIAPNGLTLEDAMRRETLEDFIASTSFVEADRTVTRWTSRGVRVVLGVGSGWTRSIPLLPDRRPACPDYLGRDEYLARQVLVVRALVERYDGDGTLDAPGSPRVDAIQVENELNEALFTALGGARDPRGEAALTSVWADTVFIDGLLRALVAAARSANSQLPVLTNVHTSVPASFDRLLGVPVWPVAVARWSEVLDWIGIDAYPNYLWGEPQRGEVLGATVTEAYHASRGRPVVVVETGYGSGPAQLGYSEAHQAEYFRASFDSARRAGAIGFFWFGSVTAEGTSTFAAEDVAELMRLASAYDRGDVAPFVAALSRRAYYDEHIAPMVEAQGRHFGLLRADGSPKPVYDAFVAEVASASP